MHFGSENKLHGIQSIAVPTLVPLEQATSKQKTERGWCLPN